jgi:hypothetical protein
MANELTGAASSTAKKQIMAMFVLRNPFSCQNLK